MAVTGGSACDLRTPAARSSSERNSQASYPPLTAPTLESALPRRFIDNAEPRKRPARKAALTTSPLRLRSPDQDREPPKVNELHARFAILALHENQAAFQTRHRRRDAASRRRRIVEIDRDRSPFWDLRSEMKSILKRRLVRGGGLWAVAQACRDRRGAARARHCPSGRPRTLLGSRSSAMPMSGSWGPVSDVSGLGASAMSRSWRISDVHGLGASAMSPVCASAMSPVLARQRCRRFARQRCRRSWRVGDVPGLDCQRSTRFVPILSRAQISAHSLA